MDKEKRVKLLFLGKKLPSLPIIFTELKSLIDKPFVSNKKIADIIKKDQSMMTKILKMSNSPLYGKRQEITNLTNAITYLGYDTLKSIVLQISLIGMFKSISNRMPDFKPSAFWEHSIGTAYISDLIVKELQLPKNENYYIAGLLHDIGKLLIYHIYPDEFEDIVLNQLNLDIPDYESEEEILGVDHTEIGFYLSETWKFHKEINNSIGYHHKMLGSRMDLVTSIVSIANVFAKNAGLCLPWDKAIDIKSYVAWEFLKKKSKKEIIVNDIVNKIIEKTDSIKEAVSEMLKVI